MTERTNLVEVEQAAVAVGSSKRALKDEELISPAKSMKKKKTPEGVHRRTNPGMVMMDAPHEEISTSGEVYLNEAVLADLGMILFAGAAQYEAPGNDTYGGIVM